MKKRLLALLLTAAMVASVAACGKTEPAATEAAPQEETTAETEAPAEEEPEVIDIEAAYAEPLTITTGFAERANIPWQEGDSTTDNLFTRAYKERYNIVLEPSFVATDTTEYVTKIDFAIVEQNLPDVFRVTKQQLDQLVEADLIWDLTEVYDQYANEGVKGLMEEEKLSFESGMYDGKLYGIAQPGGSALTQPEELWIRKDWMEDLGLSAPQSIEDVENIARAFMEEKGASYGIMAEKSLRFLMYMASCWGAHYGIWVEDEATGQLMYGTIMPEMKEALAKYAEWYEEGLLHKDFMTMDFSAQYKEHIINGEAGVCPFAVSCGSVYGGDMVSALGKDSYFVAYDYPSANGEDVLHPIKASISGYLVVSKECENPEALLKILNFYDYVQNGMAADDPELAMDMDNIQHAAEFHRLIDTRNTNRDNKLVAEAVEKRDTSALTTANSLARYEVITNWLDDPEYYTINAYLMLYEGMRVNTEIFDDSRLVYDKMWAEKPQTIVESGTILDDILIEGFTKIIIGEEPIDYFETVVAEWEQAGGAQATAEANAIYNGQ